jgi:hypothetical protein
MRPSRPVLARLVFLVPFSAAGAATYHVAPGGSDAGGGSAGAPWATLQHAADTVAAGDTVVVAGGDYAGFDLRTSGASGSPIRCLADPGVTVVTRNPVTTDGINLEGASWVEIAGFTVDGMPRNGIRAVLGHHVTIRNNRAFDNFERGIFTGFVDDLLIEDNETAGAIDEHGIYVSNSGDRPVIRGNLSYGNNGAGIHMNGDASAGGDGVISDALVEGNLIFDNGASGGSGINCDGVQDSTIRNNLIVGNHATGIALYRIDGGAPSTNNLVVNNTIVQAADGRWGITIRDGSAGNTLRNNIVLSRHSFRGGLDVEVATGSHVNLVSDHNAWIDRFTPDGGDTIFDLATWQATYGHDGNSFVSTEAALFVDPYDTTPTDGDYHLKEGAPAVDAGTATNAPATDFEGDARPAGDGVDLGADERFVAPPCVADAVVVLSDDTVTGVEVHEACDEILAGPNYTVAGGGDLTLSARGRVVLRDGFAVLDGGALTVVIDPSAGSE